MRTPRTTRRSLARIVAGLAAAPLLAGVAAMPAAADKATGPGHDQRPPGQAKKDTLRWAAPDDLVIGTAAAGGGHHLEQDYPGLEPGQSPFLHDQQYRKHLAAEFSSLSPENQMKWDFIHPERNRYDFAEADAVVEFAERNGQDVRGHTLLWHSQNPAWLTEGNFTDEELRAILKDHITTVVGRYKGRIDQWDVANEIFTDTWNDPQGKVYLRTTDNIWIKRLGPGIIADAFRWAHAADPQAKLFLNDYAVENINAKSDAYHALAKDLLAQGVPLHGFAFQAHLSLQYPFPDDFQANLQRFDDLGLETAVTELDVRMVLDESGKPTEAQLAEQARTYAGILEACLAVEECNSFTIWGFTDKYSWVPVFFQSEGAATVMWENFTRKPAYHALQDTLFEASGKPRPKETGKR
ncbi:endo-1,4-beta-xylanase [Kineococcus sp. NUM-3379]